MPTKSTSLKLPRELKARIAKLAKKTGRSAHGFMIEALERQTSREERMEAFVMEALDADQSIDAGADVYGADAVHAWMLRLARGEKPARPKPWRR